MTYKYSKYYYNCSTVKGAGLSLEGLLPPKDESHPIYLRVGTPPYPNH